MIASSGFSETYEIAGMFTLTFLSSFRVHIKIIWFRFIMFPLTCVLRKTTVTLICLYVFALIFFIYYRVRLALLAIVAEGILIEVPEWSHTSNKCGFLIEIKFKAMSSELAIIASNYISLNQMKQVVTSNNLIFIY